MGLCKCRVVTTLFCFQCKVNVCENCMVRDHKTCIVRTYLQWLQDSDFDASCRLCRLPLANGEQTVRLKCLDVFHWRCLCEQAAKLPPHTAPAGHVCAVCEDKIVPDLHAAGPIADQLRSFLATVKWSGLMLQPPAVNTAAFNTPSALALESNTAPPMYTGSQQQPPPQKSPSQAGLATPTNVASGIRMTANARKNLTQPTDDVVLEMGADADDNKYAKRPVSERIARAVSNQMASTQGSASEEDERTSGLKKTAVILLLIILAAVFILESLSRVRPSGNQDLLLDPNLNPNIRVAADQ